MLATTSVRGAFIGRILGRFPCLAEAGGQGSPVALERMVRGGGRRGEYGQREQGSANAEEHRRARARGTTEVHGWFFVIDLIKVG